MGRTSLQTVIVGRSIHRFRTWAGKPVLLSQRTMANSSDIVPLKQRRDDKPVNRLFDPNSKLYELRQYNINPIDVPEYLRLTNEKFYLRTNHSKMLGFWTSELGGLGQSIHIWEYDNLAHRTKVRAALTQDKEWQTKYVSEAVPKLISQDNSLIVPFSWGNVNIPSSKGVYEIQAYNMSSHIDVWHDRLKKVIDTRQDCLASLNSKLIGAFYTLFGRNNTVVILWQHEDFDKSVLGKIRLLTEEKDSSTAAFYHEVQSSTSKGMLPIKISPMQ